VVNWTTNVRKRNLKATVEKGKKPHHFLDFLFLADNRFKLTIAPAPVSSGKGRSKSRNELAKKGSAIRKPVRAHHKLASTKSYDSEQSIASASTALSTMTVKASNAKSAFPFPFDPFNVGAFETPRGGGGEQPKIEPVPFNYFATQIPPFHPGLAAPRVTPPRYYPFPLIYPSLEAGMCMEPPHPEIPTNHHWPTLQEASFDDDALLYNVTKNGLVTTPTRRASEDDLSIDLDDSQLLAQLSDVFKEREYDDIMDVEANNDIDDASLSTTDLDVLIDASLSAADLDVLMEGVDKDDLMDSDDIELFGEGLVDDFHIEI